MTAAQVSSLPVNAVEAEDEYVVELDVPDACVDDLRAELEHGKLELHIPRKHFGVNPDATLC